MKPKIPICDSKNLIPEIFFLSFLNRPSSLATRKRKNQSFEIPYVLAVVLLRTKTWFAYVHGERRHLSEEKCSLNLTFALGMASACQFMSVWALRMWISRTYSMILATRHDVSPHAFTQIAEQRKIIA